MQPPLAFVYRHTSGNGRLGLGWSISGIGTITRCNKTIAQDGERSPATLSVDDGYCLNGNRLRLVSGTYGTDGSVYQTELETFARITASGTAGNGPASFEVETKDGLVYEYGGTTDSRIETIGSSTARAWALSSVRDRAGNTINYEYFEDAYDGSFRPERITYATNSTASLTLPPYEVDFVYETSQRPDPIYGYWGGDDSVDGRIRQFYRLDKIEIGHDDDFDSNFDTVKIYDLDYESSGGAGGRSRLESITECAASTSDCLSPTTLTWTDSTQGFKSESNSGQSIPPGTLQHFVDLNGDGLDDVMYVSSATEGSGTWRFRLANGSGYNSEQNTGISNTNYKDTRVIEWDGDGMMDFLVPSTSNTWYVYTFNGSGFDSGYNTGIASNASNSFYTAKDVNGDGLDDLIRLEDDSSWGLKIWHRLNEGGDFASSETQHWNQADDPDDDYDITFPNKPGYAPVLGGDYRNRMRQRRLDYDGDGREDYLVGRRSSMYDGELGKWLHIDSWAVVYGAGGSTTVFTFSNWTTSSNPAFASAPPMGDFNGDGITDLAWTAGSYNSKWTIRHSNGKSVSSFVTGPNAFYMYSAAAIVTDYDHDGRDDIVVRYIINNDWYVYRGTENGLSTAASTGINTNAIGKIAEIDGNGFPDVAYVASTLKYRLSYDNPSDLLESVTDGFDVEAEFTYGLLTDSNVYTKGTGATYPQVDIKPARFVVKQLTLTDGTGEGTTFDLNYTYEGARLDVEGRGFLGFERRNVVNTSGGHNQKVEEYYEQDFPYIGALDKVYLKQSAGTMIRDVNYTWDKLSWGSGATARAFPYLDALITKQHELGGTYNGTHFRTIEYSVTSIDSTFGTVTDSSTEITEEATGLNSQSSKTERIWHSSILNDTTNWCLGRPQTTKRINSHTLNQGTSITRTTGQSWSGLYCRPTEQKIEPGDATWEVDVDLTYDDFGNLEDRTVTGKNMAARVTSIDWGSRGQFPETVTDALSFDTDQAWDYDLGLPDSVTDPNGLETSWDYDSFGRRTTETRPDGTSTTWTIAECSSGCDSREYYYIETKLRDTTPSVVRTDKAVFDQHDQLLFDYRQLPGGSSSIVADIERDARGRVETANVPYWAGGGKNGYRKFLYDSLDRVTSDRLYTSSDVLDRETEIDFEGLVTEVTDPLSNVTKQTISGWGDILRVTDAGTGNTNYEYNAFSQLKKVIDTNSVTLAVIDYNVVGMKTGLDDVDRGDWSFTPNALGEVVSQTDAKAQTTDFEYDKLGRLIERDEDEGISTWTWGTSAAANNIGRLVAVDGPDSYSEDYEFDSAGRLDKRTIGSDATYVFDLTYNNIGALGTLTYPTSTGGTRVKLKYGYDYGFNDAIQDYTDDQLGTIYWELQSVDQRGNAIDVDLGNSVSVIVGFNALTGLVDYKQSGTGGSTTNRQDLAYAWDDNGNLTERADDRQSLVEEFFYDAMNRLDYSKLGGTQNLDLAYHANGNIKNKDDVSGSDYVYDSSKIHAVITAGSFSFEYDANGNAKKRNGDDIAWTSYNKPSQIEGNGQSSDFWYAPDRSRWKQVASYSSGTETTIYVGGLMEKQTVGSVTSYKHLISAPDGTNIQQVLRSDSSSDTFYLASDHLGSTDVILDDAGDVVVYTSFDAFGQRRDPSDWDGAPSGSDMTAIGDATRRGYTGHEHLDNTDLIHMNGRVQDPVIGRFLSADPYVQAPYYSESLNRYSYVFNDPLTYSDPSGYVSDYDVHYQRIDPMFLTLWRDAYNYSNDDPVYARAVWWEAVHERNAQYGASTRAARNNFLQPDIQDDTLSEFDLDPWENEKRLIIAIGHGVWVEFVIAPIQDAAEGRILSAGCRFVKVCRAAGVYGGKIYRAGKKLYDKRVSSVPNRPLHEVADEIRTAGHPIAADRRTIAVGQDAQGNLHVGSSSGLDAGQTAAAERLGVNQVPSRPGLHAEEELLEGVRDLRSVGTSRRLPCGPGEHNCAGQLLERGVTVTNP